MSNISRLIQSIISYSIMIGCIVFPGTEEDIIISQLYSALSIFIGLNIIRISQNN
ncbi:MAG TPA: hypothetical protein PK546_01565 [Chitinophagales bacterium]|jgi:hypothetical protein|nr:hypothetical protein [Chitinophagales bacterium]HOY42135.1 hypothetical protein [Chitinophagales bacterium]HPH86951.1 hypothetical protein [Chitinophagales bacterium]HPN18193.1 hypothetical protein [Chitinophagales bacterium]